jgi:phosphate acyltransferase
MLIGLDVMGGDYAPQATVNGAVLASGSLPDGVRLVLIGPEGLIREQLVEIGVADSTFDIADAPEVIEMGENPTRAFTQKPGSSIATGFQLLRDQKIQAFCSAGNTGAMLVGSVLSVKPIEGIQRPCIMSMMPKENGGYGILLDVGSNVDCKPETLCQFALLGSMYAEGVMGIERPKVGLINIGEEPEKGNSVAQAAFQLMQESVDFNFIGNIEGRDLFNDKADVLVCDGFTGNVVLKMAEGYYSLIKARGIRDPFLDRFNYENYGGTPVLGINATVIVGHGISSARAISNMIIRAYEIESAGLNEKIKAVLQHE